MVTIEEQQPEEQHGAANAQDASENGWRELMGKDLMMKTLQPSSAEKPVAVQHQDLVLVDFLGRVASEAVLDDNDDDGAVFQKAVDWWVVVGDKDVLPGLEMGIRFCHVGETVAVWSRSKFAYGTQSTRTGGTSNDDDDSYELPLDSAVRYTVTVKRLVSAEEQARQPLTWAIAIAESKKAIANDAYAHEWSDGHGKARIQYLYEKAAKPLEHWVDNPPSSSEQSNQEENTKDLLDKAKLLLLDCLNNLVAVLLRAKDYHAAKQAAVRVLTRDADNFKALIRAAKAALLDPASSFDEVEAALTAASERASNAQQADLDKLRADFRRRQHAHQQREKQLYAGKVGGGGAAKSATKQEAAAAAKEESAAVGPPEEDVSPPEAEATTADGKKPFSWSDRSTWPWSSILAYAFQLSMPFIMWQIAQQYRADLPAADDDAPAAPASPLPGHEEF